MQLTGRVMQTNSDSWSLENVRRKQPSNFVVADPLIMCLCKVWYRISNFAAAAHIDIGHFVSFSHCFHCSLHCWFTPIRSFCVSFVLVNHLHSLQKSMHMHHLKYTLLSLIESFVPNCNDLYRQKKPVPFAWFHLPILCCVITSAAWLHKR